MSRRNKRKQREVRHASAAAVDLRRGMRVRVAIICAISAAVVVSAVVIVLRSDEPASAPRAVDRVSGVDALVENAFAPRTLGELMLSGGEALPAVDIARVNLLCAEDLPGAEKLDLDACLARLDQWAERVRTETDRNVHRFAQNPAEYEYSPAYFRMLLLITVLQQDFGVHYNQERIRDVDFRQSQDLFIHGLVGHERAADNSGGTCVSMPVLYSAVARRLGYPVRLVTTKAHLFCRWDAPDHPYPALRGRFNIEATNQGMSSFPDDYYKTWPYKVSDTDVARNGFLKSLSPVEEVAEFLAARGHCLLENGRVRAAADAYAQAAKLSPFSPLLAGFRDEALRILDPRRGQVGVARVPRVGVPIGRRWQPEPRFDPMAHLREIEEINARNRHPMDANRQPTSIPSVGFQQLPFGQPPSPFGPRDPLANPANRYTPGQPYSR